MKTIDLRKQRYNTCKKPDGLKFHNYICNQKEGYINEFLLFKDVEHLMSIDDIHPDELYHPYTEHNEEAWTFGESLLNLKNTKKQLTSGLPSKYQRQILSEIRLELTQIKPVQDNLRLATMKRARTKYSDYGDDLDINRLMCGSPEHWTQRDRRKVDDAVKIHYHYGLSCGNKETEFAKLAALTIVATELLQRMGKSVEIIGIHSLDRRNGLIQGVLFPIKKADEPLNVTKLASLGCPGLLRHYTFKAIANYIEDNKDHQGAATKLSEYDRKHLGIDYMIEKQWIDGNESTFLEDIFKKETSN